MDTTRYCARWTALALIAACNDDPSAATVRRTQRSDSPATADVDSETAAAEAEGESVQEPPADDAGEATDAGEVVGGELDGGELDGGAVPQEDAAVPQEDASPDAAVQADIAVAGRWHSNFGGVEAISSSVWRSYGAVRVVRYDNAARVVILQNPSDDAYGPNLYSKVTWTEPQLEGFHYCTVAFGKDTAAEAEAATGTVDASDLAGGCNGFPWTQLSPVLELEGRWHSNYGGVSSIDSDAWGGSPVVHYDNAANVAVTQNSPTAAYFPGKFNKLVWTEPSGGKFYYCTIDYGLDTAAAARNSTKVADASDPSKTGCGGFSWTELGPTLEIEGSYVLGDATLAISSDRWGERRITRYDNTLDRAVVRNADGVTYDLVVWTRYDGVLYVCTTASAQATAAAAEGAAFAAVASDLRTGCAGSAWTGLHDAP